MILFFVLYFLAFKKICLYLMQTQLSCLKFLCFRRVKPQQESSVAPLKQARCVSIPFKRWPHTSYSCKHPSIRCIPPYLRKTWQERFEQKPLGTTFDVHNDFANNGLSMMAAEQYSKEIWLPRHSYPTWPQCATHLCHRMCCDWRKTLTSVFVRQPKCVSNGANSLAYAFHLTPFIVAQGKKIACNSRSKRVFFATHTCTQSHLQEVTQGCRVYIQQLQGAALSCKKWRHRLMWIKS